MSDVRFLVSQNKDMKRQDLIKLVSDQFGVKSNTANMYIYKTLKALEAGPVVSKAKAKAVKAKARIEVSAEKAEDVVAEVKAKNLEVMKEVSRKSKIREEEAKKIRAELASYEAEIDEYVASGDMPQLFRKDITVAA
jgi:hypothetical protein